MRVSPGNTAATHNIPHQPQYVVHGQNYGADTLEGLKPNPTCVDKDTIRVTTRVGGERQP